MKTLCSIFLLTAATYSANATVINFASNSTAADSTQSNSIGNNLLIAKNPAWSNPISGSNWISYGNTGDTSVPGFFVVANGTIVTFNQRFTLTAADLSTNGTVSVLADDSTSVVLNGTVIRAEAPTAGNTYSTCSDTQPNCITPTVVVLPSIYLVAGNNVLSFGVAQRAGSSFGLDYKGSVGAAATPEPSSWALLATGALLIGVGVRKRSQVRQ